MSEVQTTLLRCRTLGLTTHPLYELANGLASQDRVDFARLRKLTTDLSTLCDEEELRQTALSELDGIRQRFTASRIQDSVLWSGLKAASALLREPYDTLAQAVKCRELCLTNRRTLEDRLASLSSAETELEALGEQAKNLDKIEQVSLQGAITRARNSLRYDIQQGQIQVERVKRVLQLALDSKAAVTTPPEEGAFSLLADSVKERLRSHLTVADYEAVQANLASGGGSLGQREAAWKALATQVVSLHDSITIAALSGPALPATEAEGHERVTLARRLETLLLDCKDKSVVLSVRRQLLTRQQRSIPSFRACIKKVEEALRTGTAVPPAPTSSKASPATLIHNSEPPTSLPEPQPPATPEVRSEDPLRLQVLTITGDQVVLLLPAVLPPKERQALEHLVIHGQLSESELRKLLKSKSVSGLLATLQKRLCDQGCPWILIDTLKNERLYKFVKDGTNEC